METLLSKRILKLKENGINSNTIDEIIKEKDLSKIEYRIDVCLNIIKEQDENNGLTPTRGMGMFNMAGWE
jgi:hypothetical protein